MGFMRKNWYYVGGGVFLVLSAVLAMTWGRMGVPQRLLLMSFMALLVHQLEEYAWPGGFPAVMNVAWMPRAGTRSDRFPLNRRSALFVNVLFAYPYYVVPVLLPGVVWLGLGQVAFGVAQLAIHGVVINRKMRSIYNPGLFVVVFLHLPIGIYYTWYAVTNGLVAPWMWPAAAAWLAFGAVVGVALPVTRWFADPGSPFAFSQEEMARFHVQEKIARQKLRS